MHQPAGHITQALIITGTHITSPSILFYPTKHTHTHETTHQNVKGTKVCWYFLGYKFTKKVSRAKKYIPTCFFPYITSGQSESKWWISFTKWTMNRVMQSESLKAEKNMYESKYYLRIYIPPPVPPPPPLVFFLTFCRRMIDRVVRRWNPEWMRCKSVMQ